MNKLKMTIRPENASESGVVLITALILLVIMTLIGLAGIKISTQEEKMAGYLYDRGLTFQAAEAAMRQAEAAIELIKPTPTSGGCTLETLGASTLKICPTPAPASDPRWNDSTFAGWQNAQAVGSGVLAITPQYFVEFLGADNPCGFDPDSIPTCKRYRISARAGTSGRAAVMLQAIYATD